MTSRPPAPVRPPAPLVELCAPPGAGKTTLLPYLVAAAAGEVVADVDELLEDDALLGVPIATPTAAPVWPAYDRLWQRIAQLSRRAGHPVILLSQVPDVTDLAVPPATGVVRLGWDLPDPVRRRRLAARGWDEPLITGALTDAALVRAHLPDVFTDPGTVPPAELAVRLLTWIRATTGLPTGRLIRSVDGS